MPIKRFTQVALLSLGLFLGMAIDRAIADQPHMEAGLSLLQQARTELQKAEHDKGGHRGQAVNLISQAIEEVKLGIAAGRGK